MEHDPWKMVIAIDVASCCDGAHWNSSFAHSLFRDKIASRGMIRLSVSGRRRTVALIWMEVLI